MDAQPENITQPGILDQDDLNSGVLNTLTPELLEQAIAHTAGGLIIFDAQQTDLPIIYVSSGFESLTGYCAHEVIGRNCRFLEGVEPDQISAQELQQAIASGRGSKVLLRNYRKGGDAFWSEVTLSPIINTAGTVTHYVRTQIDITHYIESFQTLQRTEEKYRHLYEETPAMMHSIDSSGRIKSMSRYWLEKLGYQREDVISQPLSAFLTADAQQTVDDMLAALESKTVDRSRACQFIKKNGERIDVLLSTVAGCSDKDSCSDQLSSNTKLGVLVDITKRKKAEEKLRRSEALLRAINNLPPTGIFVMDCHTNEALFINNEFYKIWQVEHLRAAVEGGEINGEEVLAECLSEIDLSQFVATSTAQDFSHGNKIVEDEVPMLDGRTLRRIYGPIQENDETFAYLYIFEDITERKQAVQKLARATEAAESANRAKSEFLANMSHELRSPLNAILGFTHILQNDELSRTQKENLDIIRSSSEHLLALINDILDISKIEAGKVVLSPSEFDLYQLVDELPQMFSTAVGEKGLTLKVVRSPHLPRVIYSDRLKLRQILINLLGNAVKFTATGSITLIVDLAPSTSQSTSQSASQSTSQSASQSAFQSATNEAAQQTNTVIAFAVTDTGAGINPTDQQRLFEAFVQTNSALTGQQGTGLGLAISNEYIQLLGGQLAVNSALGKGSTFSFSIAVRPVDSASEQPLETATTRGRVVGLAPGQPQYKILVADDVDLNRKLLVHLLSTAGFEVHEACDGKDAIAHWQAWQPHLIWMDIRMPVMSGEEAASRIKKQDKDNRTCIIALTANAFEEDKIAALASGCDDFVSKPIKPSEIFDKMAQHLGLAYQYEDSDQTSKAPSPSLSSALLAQATPEWRHALTQAVLDLDDEQILSLASQLPHAQQTLAAALKQQTESLAYKQLLQMLQEADTVGP
ncbi:MAG: PAS domain S-box protein [Phormidesmis sp.]